MVICPLSEQAQSIPHHPALISEGRTLSYLDCDNAVHSLCAFLGESGIKEHQRVAFIATNHPSTILLFFALFRLRAIACPLSFRLPPEQISTCLQQIQVSHFLEPASLPLNVSPSSSSSSTLSLDAGATLLFTSGSSGVPKIACHTYANHYYNALGATPLLQLEPSSRWLLSLPLFHVGGIGILFRCFQKGAAVALSDLPFAQAIPHFQITHLSLVPTQLYRLIQEPDPQLARSLECLLLGGAPLSPDLIRQAHGRNFPVHTTYGMTEMSSMITLSEGNATAHAGKVLPLREMKIEKDNEIWVRGKTLFEGYWDPASGAVIGNAVNQWFPTRDLGKLTPEGNLEVIGRKDRQFISGGENIQPEEIEQALCAIPGIRKASVLPRDDPEFGQRPIAFIDDETHSHTLQSIRAALSSTLPGFKHPVAISAYPADFRLFQKG